MKNKITPDEARAILAERAKKDPAKHYQPGPTQTLCLHSKARYRLLRGGNRSGKTSHAAMELSMAARRIHPVRTTQVNGLYIVFAPTRDQITDPWNKKLLEGSELAGEMCSIPMIPPWEIKNQYKVHGTGKPMIKEIQLHNGNRVIFCPSNDPNVWKRIQGKGMVLGVIIDEAAGNRKLLMECAARLLDANSNTQVVKECGGGWILWGATPTMVNDGLEHFKEKCESGDPDFATFHIQPDENPAIDPAERERMRAFMTDDEFRIRMVGDASASDMVQIYGKQWDDQRHMLKSDYIPGHLDNLCVGYDPGVDHPMGMIITAIRSDEPMRLYVVKCWMLKGGTIDDDINRLADWLKGRKLATFVYDTNLKNTDRGGGPSVLAQMAAKLQARDMAPLGGFRQSKKNHLPGISLVRHYLDPVPTDKTAQPLILVNPSEESGGKILRGQMLSYRGKEETGFTGAGGVVKKNDEMCFVAGTMITMADGCLKPIEQVAAGDMVATPIGPRAVVASAKTGHHTVVRMSFSTGMAKTHFTDLTGTTNHPIFTDCGLVPMGDISTQAIFSLKEIGRNKPGTRRSISLALQHRKKWVNDLHDVANRLQTIPWGTRDVFNITVDGAHCYYANGILVSNCDAIRYLVMSRPAYNREWACGGMADYVAAPRPGQPVAVESPRILTPHEQRMEHSRLMWESRQKRMSGVPSTVWL